jgi:hypothetical protein
MQNNLNKNIFIALITSFIVFLLVPIYMIGQSPKTFEFLDIRIFFICVFFFIASSSSLLISLITFFYAFGLPKVANYLNFFLLSWVVLAGFILPVCKSGVIADPVDIPTNYLNFAVLAISSTLLTFLTSTPYKKFTFQILILIGCSASISSIYLFFKNNTFTSNNEHLNVSNQKNIFVVSFDGLSGKIFLESIANNSKFADIFKDFNIYDNVLSQSPSTEASIMGEIYGIRDYKSISATQTELNKKLENKFNSLLITNKVKDSYIFGPYPTNIARHMNLDPPAIISKDNYLNKSDTFDLFKYVLVRVATNRVIKYSNWDVNLMSFKNELMPNPPNLPFRLRLTNSFGPSWDRPLNSTIEKYDYWVDNLKASNKEYSIRYLHFTFSHFPVDFDNHCEFKSDDSNWYQLNQNEIGMYGENICVLEKFSNFINKLKLLGIYDKSLIVFKSDHGGLATYFSQSPDNLKINNHQLFGFNRYMPALMIKDFNSNQFKVSHKKELVLLNDIAKTLCKSSGIVTDCNYLNGVNLLGNEIINFDEPYYLYIVKNENSNYDFDTHISLKIPSRRMKLIDALNNSNLVHLSQ